VGKPHIIYRPREDATPEREAGALAATAKQSAPAQSQPSTLGLKVGRACVKEM
jgi:hypothetical protein